MNKPNPTDPMPLLRAVDVPEPTTSPRTADEFAAEQLGVNRDLVFAASETMDALARSLVGYTLAREVDRAQRVTVGPGHKKAPARWGILELNHGTELVPVCASLAFPAGGLAPVPVVARVVDQWPPRVEIVTSLEHASLAHALLTDLVHRSRGGSNPLRGQVLQAGWKDHLVLRVIGPPQASREQLILPDDMWATVDANVHRLLDKAPSLVAAGLSANRGLLLSGPPGTGKTALSRVLATEVAGRATVVICDEEAAQYGVAELYSYIEHLAPALVIIEDLDLIAQRRGFGGDGALHGFLTALDGVSTTDECVITVASTNDANAIDEAAKRAARFDIVLRLPPPTRVARQAILDGYLAHIDHDVDTDAVAAHTDGLTGADLRELVRRAVIEDDRPTTARLLAYADERRPTELPGAYL